jgi:hypothetical protein
LSGQAGGDYLWQSLEAGDLGGIENTSQYAGWRFSALKDAYVTELCGYFKGVYSVNLYDGAYNLKASGQITGYEQWNCASIAPIAVFKGEKYYVVAEILNSPVYYRSGASMLPRQNKEAIIESGITQRINQPFGSDMKSDDSRVFGMVDVKITSKQEAEILIKKAGASLAQAVSGAAGNEAAGNFSAVVRNCAHGKCIACAAESCRIESDEQSKDQKENTFIQICAKGNCWSCTNENCAKTDAAGFVKTGYSFKNCKNNKCINCLNGQCNVTGGQEPTYYKWDAAGGGMDGGSFFMDTGTGGSGGGGSGAWESYYGGNYSGDAFGGGGGGGFDAKAAAVALVNHAFTDQDFIDALLAYMAAAKEEGITNTTPTYGQLAEFINRAAGETLIDTDSVSVKEQSTVSSAIETMAPIYSAFSMTKTDPKTGALVVTPGNPETAASTRASSLTTGWGSKMNAPVAKDADGKEIYVAVNVGEEVTAGSSFSVPLYVLENGKIVSKGVTGYSVKNSATAPHSSEEANAINANGGIVYVPVRESTPAYGLLNSSTAATFTNNGKKAAGGGVSQVAAGLPANAIVVDAPSVSDNSSTQGATVASSVISDWLPTGSADKTAAATTKTGGAAATVYVPKVVAASPTAIASADGTAKIESDPQTVADNSRKIIDEIKSQMSETVVDESTGEIEIIPPASERTNDLIYAWGSNTLGQAVGQIEVTANADGTPINASTVIAHQAITYSPAAVRTITEGGEAKTSLVYAAPTTYYLTEEDVASIKAGNVLYAPVVAAEPLSLNSGIGSEFQPVEKTGNANTLTTGAPGHSFQATAQVSDSSAGGAQQNDTVSDTARAIENTGGLSLVDSQKNFLDDGNEIPLSTEIFYSDAVNWLRLPSGSIKDSYETIAAADYRRAGYFEFRDAGLSFKKIISKSSGSAAAAVGDLSAGSGDASAAGTAAKSKIKGRS